MARTPEKKLAYNRAYRAANRDRINASRDYFVVMLRHRHGMRPEQWIELWNAQGGKCYLCGYEMEEPNGTLKRNGGTTAVIDHDHSCCPQNKSCSICRRGLAHVACNSAVGLLFDDPARLRRAADAFEAAQLAVQNRKQTVVEPLFDMEGGGALWHGPPR